MLIPFLKEVRTIFLAKGKRRRVFEKMHCLNLPELQTICNIFGRVAPSFVAENVERARVKACGSVLYLRRIKLKNGGNGREIAAKG